MKKQIALRVLIVAVFVLAGGQRLQAQQAQNNDRAIAADRKYAWDNGYIYVVHIDRPIWYWATNQAIGDPPKSTQTKESIITFVERDWGGKPHGMLCSYYLYDYPGGREGVFRGEIFYYNELRYAKNVVERLLKNEPDWGQYRGDLTGLLSIKKLVTADREVDLEEEGTTSR